MIDVGTARRAILDACRPLPPRPLPLGQALGRVTASPTFAAHDVPPFANSAMDGFAVRAADTAGAPVTLEVVGTAAAGSGPGVEVGPGQAVRIMTGAVMPAGADAVVMVERTAPAADGRVLLQVAAAPGDHVRGAGEDQRAGEVVFGAGVELGPGHLGALASVGIAAVEVVPGPRVGVLSTGDELVAPGGELAPGRIHDSNRPMLLALAERAGCTPVDLGTAPDDEAAIAEALGRGAATCDAVVTSGGVSVGDFDHVKAVLDRLGTMHWWQVAVRPAKPLAFGLIGGTPVLGLPGNPVSALVSFELFARPALRLMGGHRRLMRPEVAAVAEEALRRRPDGKLHLVRVSLSGGPGGPWRARPVGGQGSHLLWAMALADGLALLPDGHGVEAGAEVATMLLADSWSA